MKLVKTYASLYILQLEQYDFKRWFNYQKINHFPTLSNTRLNLVFTGRVKITLVLAVMVWLMGLWVMGLDLGMAIAVGIANCILVPMQKFISKKQELYIKNRLKQSNAIVVGITGSFGKSSVKNMLYEILDRDGYALVSENSFNTVAGIYRQIRQELSKRHKYAILELGAYGKGDINKLGEMINADWGIITDAGRQHLERFGSLDKVVQTKSELIDVVKNGVIVNGDNLKLREYLGNKAIWVTWKSIQGDYWVTDVIMNKDGSSFKLNNKKQILNIKTKLFGSVNIMNSALAAALAWEMGVDHNIIIEGLSKAEAFEHRLELRQSGKATIIDNTFSSNETGFRQIIKDVKNLSGRKVLVTPGLVELGQEETKIHQDLANNMIGVFDEVVLVGNSNRVKVMNDALGDKVKVSFIANNTSDYWQKVNDLTNKFDWVLLENDVPEQYD